jgi:hypothetical protein
MTLDFVKALFDGLNFTVRPESLSEPQVQALEKQLNLTFPASYRDFLLWMGQSRAGMLLGSDWLPDDLPGLKAKATKLLAGNNFPEKLPDDAFVFWMSQGYVFTFIRLSQGDNSPVYRYHGTLDTQTFTQINQNFGEWLTTQIQDHVQRMKSLGQQW